MATKFDICSSALVQIGANKITAFDSSSREAIVAGEIYDNTVEEWLAAYWWRFASKSQQLSRITGSDPVDPNWTAHYTQPGDMIAIESIQVAGVNIDFDRNENKILCNASATDAVIAEYTYAISETYWPAYFRRLIELDLMHKMSFALPAKLDLKRVLKEDVDMYFRQAKSIDQKQQPNKPLPLSGRRSIMEFRRS